MERIRSLFTSPIGKKLLTGITGLGLTLFVLAHMVGNLTYFAPDPNAYNLYAEALVSLGPLFWAIELGLLAFFVVHIVLGIRIYLGKRRARPVGYAEYRSAGGPSKQSVSSQTMIVTGCVLLVFLVFHVWSFKYGPDMSDGYVVAVEGAGEIRDLKRLLEEKFKHPLYAFGYPAVMLLLALHLRHGVWSAMQSLGATNPRLTPVIYAVGTVLGLAIAIGFLVLPLWIYFGGGA